MDDVDSSKQMLKPVTIDVSIVEVDANVDNNVQGDNIPDVQDEARFSVEQLLQAAFMGAEDSGNKNIAIMESEDRGNQQTAILEGEDSNNQQTAIMEGEDRGNQQTAILEGEDSENQPTDHCHKTMDASSATDTSELPRKQWQCDRCGRVFFSRSGIKAHTDTVHDGIQYACRICGVKMKWKYNLRTHMRKVHNIGELPWKITFNRKCQKCGITFSTNVQLDHHKFMVHKEMSYKCKVCGKMFPTVSKLSTHKLCHSELVLYTCSVCSLRYRSKGSFESHIKKMGHQQTRNEQNGVPESEESKKDLVCPKCNRGYNNYMSFLTHVHSSRTCSRFERTRHLRIANITKCMCCGKSFATRTDTRRHLQLEHGIKVPGKSSGKDVYKYSCPVCKKLVTEHSLWYHQQKHSGVKKHACDQCNYKCIYLLDLQKHKKRHIPLRPMKYPCRFCSRQFDTKGNWVRHENRLHLHIGIKPYQCEVCQRRFEDNFYRRKHQKNCKKRIQSQQEFKNPPEAPKPIGFRCILCSAVFANKSHLTVHKKKCQFRGFVKNDEPLLNAMNSDKESIPQEEVIGKSKVVHHNFLPSCPFCSEICKDYRDLTKHEKKCMVRKQAKRKTEPQSDCGGDGDNVHGQTEEESGDQILKEEHDIDDKKVSSSGSALLSYNCSKCSKSTAELIKQLCPSHEITCSFCKTAFTTAQELEDHFTAEHLDEEQSMADSSLSNACSMCGKTTETLIQEHIASHQLQFPCTECSVVLRSKASMKRHQQTHKSTKNKFFECRFCSKTFESKKTLKIHKQMKHYGKDLKTRRTKGQANHTKKKQDTKSCTLKSQILKAKQKSKPKQIPEQKESKKSKGKIIVVLPRKQSADKDILSYKHKPTSHVVQPGCQTVRELLALKHNPTSMELTGSASQAKPVLTQTAQDKPQAVKHTVSPTVQKVISSPGSQGETSVSVNKQVAQPTPQMPVEPRNSTSQKEASSHIAQSIKAVLVEAAQPVHHVSQSITPILVQAAQPLLIQTVPLTPHDTQSVTPMLVQAAQPTPNISQSVAPVLVQAAQPTLSLLQSVTPLLQFAQPSRPLRMTQKPRKSLAQTKPKLIFHMYKPPVQSGDNAKLSRENKKSNKQGQKTVGRSRGDER